MLGDLVGRLPRGRLRALAEQGQTILPGLLVAGTISLAATFLSDHYGGPVMLFALLLGMAFNFLAKEGPCVPGIAFTARTVLRCGVALLGARITLDAVLALGPTPIVTVLLGVPATILFGVVLSRRLGFGRDFGILTGGAVAICGASAALAIASVLPKGPGGIGERDTIFTVIGVTTLSTVAMVLYPLVTAAFGMAAEPAGVFLGATIHDVAQVVGAGYSISTEAGDAATVTKLLRVAMLVPVVLAITMLLFRGAAAAGGRPGFPPFLLVFVALVAINSLGLIPEPLRVALVDLSRWALVAAIAALGIKTALKDLAAVGPRALVLIVAETGWIALLGLAIVLMLG
jgi:uncharacterized integral membrane protein (TIGR00698 family)